MTRKEQVNRQNEMICRIVVERARRDFPKDIDLIAGTGSYFRGEGDEYSDIDLLIVPCTERGKAISHSFILNGIGYDLYCTSWQQLEDMATFSPYAMVSHVIDPQILYARSPEQRTRFERLRQKAKQMAKEKPSKAACIQKATIPLAKAQEFLGKLVISKNRSRSFYFAGRILQELQEALFLLNGSYLKGSARCAEQELAQLPWIPQCYGTLCEQVRMAKDLVSLQKAVKEAVTSVADLIKSKTEVRPLSPQPGILEEFHSNYWNKAKRAFIQQDIRAAFDAAIGAQSFCDEMQESYGFPAIDIMKGFSQNDLSLLVETMTQAEQCYRRCYEQGNQRVCEYPSLEAFCWEYGGFSLEECQLAIK